MFGRRHAQGKKYSHTDPSAISAEPDGHHDDQPTDRFRYGGEAEVAREVERSRATGFSASVAGFRIAPPRFVV
jgi:hypothetical protein